MVWGCFSSNGMGPIFKIDGIMDRYVYKGMLPYSRRNMPRGWIFQQDNDPKHTSKLISDWFTSKKVKVMEWPPQSPDLNPIENMSNPSSNVLKHSSIVAGDRKSLE